MFNKRLLFAWALAGLISYIAIGFLDAYYTSVIGIALVSVIVHAVVTLFAYFVLGRLAEKFKTHAVDGSISVALVVSVIAFFAGLVIMASRFPRQFDASAYAHAPETLTRFFVGVAAALPSSMWMVGEIRRRGGVRVVFTALWMPTLAA